MQQSLWWPSTTTKKDLNGKGKTMLMRTTLLKDAVQWGNNEKDVSWKNEPTPAQLAGKHLTQHG